MIISTWKVAFGWIMCGFLLWLGFVLLISATGIHPALQSDTPIAAFLFGTPFALVMIGAGLFIAYLPLRASGLVAQLRWPRLLQHLARLLWRRPDRAALTAFLPPAVLALQYGLHGNPWLPDSLALSIAQLEDTLTIEFLLIHGFPFLALSVMYAGSGKPGARASGATLFLILLAAYLALALKEAGGLLSVIVFLYLMLPDLLALARHRSADPDHPAVTLLAIRWSQQFILFMTGALIMEAHGSGAAGTRWMGTFFFCAIALQELFRIPEIPLEVAAQWQRKNWRPDGF